MTSEVLILNKRGVVIGADSAVTTSGGSQPRYSKAATKIFEISGTGQVAAAIYGDASIDRVPWELALKLYRQALGAKAFATVSEYATDLMKFLSGNPLLFPDSLRKSWVEGQFDEAAAGVLRFAEQDSTAFRDPALSLVDRRASWAATAGRLRNTLQGIGCADSLSQGKLDLILANLGEWSQRLLAQLAAAPDLEAIEPTELAELAHRLRYARPDLQLGSTGIAVAGYGEAQIFPAYSQLRVFGHVGDEVCFLPGSSFEVSHDSTGMIQPLAQSSMIDVFTDGFGDSLVRIIEEQSRKALVAAFQEVTAAGVAIDPTVIDAACEKAHADFMLAWKKENWRINYSPLVQVIQSLSMQEMAHLAESLLNLESLKERVTLPSESVGGPIDVAAITKAEGLVWIKRKHYFDPSINLRYSLRLQKSIDHATSGTTR